MRKCYLHDHVKTEFFAQNKLVEVRLRGWALYWKICQLLIFSMKYFFYFYGVNVSQNIMDCERSTTLFRISSGLNVFREIMLHTCIHSHVNPGRQIGRSGTVSSETLVGQDFPVSSKSNSLKSQEMSQSCLECRTFGFFLILHISGNRKVLVGKRFMWKLHKFNIKIIKS